MDASQIFPVPCLTDNFAWVFENARKEAFVVDPGESAPLEEHLAQRGAKLTHILITHYHFDHVGGAGELSEKTGAKIWAPREAVQPLDKILEGGTTEEVGGLSMQVIETLGHALNHVSLYFPQLKALFCGDVLFVLGCGRLFDGSAEEMWQSLLSLRALPPDTRVYCGHDYTTGNLRFVRSLKGFSDEGERVITALETTRAAMPDDQAAGLPSRLKDEACANPFMLADDASFLRANDISQPAGAEAFKELRRRKDRF